MQSEMNLNQRRLAFRGAALLFVVVVPVLVLVAVFSLALADSYLTDFESFTLGTIDGQDGWNSDGAAGMGCAVYDHEIDDPTAFGAGGFGSRALRISNAVASGCFGDFTFTKSLGDEAGETDAENGGMSGGTRQPYFEASFDFISTKPLTEQVGLSVDISPDRGDGARMGVLRIDDTPGGFDVLWIGYDTTLGGTCADLVNFVFTTVATDLDRSVVHNIRITMAFVDGINDDVVQIYIDDVLVHTGKSWEDFFRNCQPPGSRTVDSLLFRRAVAAPSTAGFGFLFDNYQSFSGPVPLPPEPDGYYLSTDDTGTVDAIAYGPEDILFYDPLSSTWSLFFDGSDNGLMASKHNLNAIHISNTVAADDLYFSLFQNKVNVPDVGNVLGHDIVHFDGSDYELYFDGSDVGLTTVMEKIDGLHILPGSFSPIGGSCDQYLLISTLGVGKVPAFGGGMLSFQGEDILGFCLTNSGAATAGFWHLFLDGSDQGMPKNSTDSISADLENDKIYLTTKGTFNVDSAFGGHSMVYVYDLVTEEFSGPIFDASTDLTEKVDALQVSIAE